MQYIVTHAFSMRGPLGLFGQVYEMGEYEKTDSFQTSSNL